jgi:hypothetical protein
MNKRSPSFLSVVQILLYCAFRCFIARGRKLGRPGRSCDREMGWVVMDWMNVAMDGDRRRALVNTVKNLRVLWNVGKFLSSCAISGFSRGAQHHGVSCICKTGDQLHPADLIRPVLLFYPRINIRALSITCTFPLVLSKESPNLILIHVLRRHVVSLCRIPRAIVVQLSATKILQSSLDTDRVEIGTTMQWSSTHSC